jgi:RHS repeat-associated protein
MALAAIPTGDLNADGALDGADVMLGQRIVDGTLTPNPVGDVSPLEQAPDGTIDSSDVLLLTRGAGEEDVDGDGLSDQAELADGTSPFRRDTDQDGVLDGAETGGGPSSARLNPDQDNDGIVDGEDALATTAAAPFEVLYVHADHLGGTAIATNDAGTVVRKVKYGIFGEVRGNAIETGAPATTPDPREKFTGQRYDAATALYYYGARYYDPGLGRFIQADPIVPEPFDPQSFNRYAYVKNEPLTSVDPTGYYEEDAIPICGASCELNWQIQRDLDAFRARPDPGYQGRSDLLGFQSQEHLPNYDSSLRTSPGAAAGQGVAKYVGVQSAIAGDVRAAHDATVRALDPFDSMGRSAIKEAARADTPLIFRDLITSIRPSTDPRPGSIGSANVPNARVSLGGSILRVGGRVVVGASLVIDAGRIYLSSDRSRTAVQVGFGTAGAFGVGTLGALGGSAVAPGLGTFIGGVGGAAVGGAGGEALGGAAFDFFFR